MASQQMTAQQAAQLNLAARRLVTSTSLNMLQQVATGTLVISGGTLANQIINIPCRNVGLIKRFWVKINLTLAQSASETLTRTQFGPANLLSNVVFTDLSNYQRINTPGWHLDMVASAKAKAPYGAAYTTDSPVNWGSNFGVIKSPASITTASTIQMFYEVPLAYSDSDLRGAMFANIVNATYNLQLTFNPNFVVATGTDATLAGYQSSSSAVGTISAVTWTVYQNYLGQLPVDKNGAPILPTMDLSLIYNLVNTNLSGMTVGADFPLPYSNYRSYLSTCVIYDNGGTLAAGTDTNRWKLQTANFLNIFDVDPFTQTLQTRLRLGDDPPLGTYYFDSRDAPIATIQSGNMNLIGNFSNVAGSTSVCYIGYEAMLNSNSVTQAGSIPGG